MWLSARFHAHNTLSFHVHPKQSDTDGVPGQQQRALVLDLPVEELSLARIGPEKVDELSVIDATTQRSTVCLPTTRSDEIMISSKPPSIKFSVRVAVMRDGKTLRKGFSSTN